MIITISCRPNRRYKQIPRGKKKSYFFNISSDRIFASINFAAGLISDRLNPGTDLRINKHFGRDLFCSFYLNAESAGRGDTSRIARNGRTVNRSGCNSLAGKTNPGYNAF